MDLLPTAPLTEIAKVLTFGAEKYDAHNWRGGLKQSRLIASALRHLLAYNDGEDNDPESGLPHLAHLGCCVVFMLEQHVKGTGEDDRYRPPVNAKNYLIEAGPALTPIDELLDRGWYAKEPDHDE